MSVSRRISVAGDICALCGANRVSDQPTPRTSPHSPPLCQKKGTGLMFQERSLRRSSRRSARGKKGRRDDSSDDEDSWTGIDEEPTTKSVSREYMGCYADDKGDRVMGYKLSRRDMTTELCRSYCLEMNAGHLYYATQVRLDHDHAIEARAPSSRSGATVYIARMPVNIQRCTRLPTHAHHCL